MYATAHFSRRKLKRTLEQQFIIFIFLTVDLFENLHSSRKRFLEPEDIAERLNTWIFK